jgi:hypothetical protein
MDRSVNFVVKERRKPRVLGVKVSRVLGEKTEDRRLEEKV